ncbi:MAG: hypothetical protein IT554_00445 [Sphingomonadaceae bacterium]|nr:hypothetical protein [Sphingomonadaceae bacterium]
MRHSGQATWFLVVTWWRIAFATHLLYSGIAYASVGWVPMDMTKGTIGIGDFLNQLNAIGLYSWVKYFEIFTGLFLLTNRAVPLVLVLHMPITMMIAYLNLVVHPVGRELYTGPQELGFHIPLLVAYGGYYAPFLRWRAEPWWLWSNFPARALAPIEGDQPSRDTAISPARALLVVGLVSAVILSASYLLSPPERQLVPRDWMPIIIGTLALLGQWAIISRKK